MKKIIFICLISLSFKSFADDFSETTTNVQFKKGNYSSEYHGVVRDYSSYKYVFYAKKGQLLTSTLTDKTGRLGVGLQNKNFEFSIFPFSQGAIFRPNDPYYTAPVKYILPYNGKYTITIDQYRTFARRHKISPFIIKIKITDVSEVQKKEIIEKYDVNN